MISDLSKLLRAIREQVNPVGKPAAVVFNCHITGLEVVRSLGKRGIPTIGLDQDESAYGLHSRYTTVAGECPYPLKDERGFIDLLLEIGSTLNQRAVLFPCLDEWVFAVARHRSELERFFILPCSDLDIIERILDKNLLYRKCEERGIPIPRTHYVGDQTPEQIANEIDFPCIVKPALQREFTNEFGDKVFRAESRDKFLRLCRRAAHHPLLVQEIVGSGVDSFYSLGSYIGQDGQAKGVFVGRKLEQYPPDFGTGCLVDSRYVPEIVERGVDILKQFAYRGISEVEFIYDERDRDYKLLDINTRAWKWIGLPIRAGVDLVWLAYSDAVNGKVERAGRQIDGLKWVWLKDYVQLRKLQAGKSEATLSDQDWFDLLTGKGDTSHSIVSAVFSNDDPAPFGQVIKSLSEEKQYYCAC